MPSSEWVLSLYRAARLMPSEEFRGWLNQQLSRHLRFASSLWWHATIGLLGPELQDFHAFQLPDAVVAAFLGLDGCRETLLWHLAAFARPGKAWACDLQAMRSADLRGIAESLGSRYWLVTGHTDATAGTFSGFVFQRSSAEPHFSEAERAWAEWIEPHLIECWLANWLADAGRRGRSPHAPAFGFATLRGRTTFAIADARFQNLLVQEFPDSSGARVPEPLSRHLAQAHDAPWIGRTCTMYITRGPKDAFTTLQLRPAHRFDRLPFSQRNVARLFAGGRSQADVARSLGLSRSTVNNYLLDIYRALGVGDKAELATLLGRIEPDITAG